MESAAKIKEILQAASMEKLPEFIAEYENDPRSGVQKLVSSAQKKIDALEKERHERVSLLLQLIEHLRQVVACREINSFVKLVHFRRELPELLVRDAKDVSCFKKG